MKKGINFIVRNAGNAIHFLDLCIPIVIYATNVITESKTILNIVNFVKNVIMASIFIVLNAINAMKDRFKITSIVNFAKISVTKE
jgi:hypothetical protein